MNYEQANVFPIISGLEILYNGEECPKYEQAIPSKLMDIPSTIIIQESLKDSFCIIYQISNTLPTSLTRYDCDVAFLLNVEQLCFEDLQEFPDIWDFVNAIIDVFELKTHVCVIKPTHKIKSVFKELREIPLPPTMFRFYILLKALETLLLLKEINIYSSQVHFYPCMEFLK